MYSRGVSYLRLASGGARLVLADSFTFTPINVPGVPGSFLLLGSALIGLATSPAQLANCRT
jgi:hypothetical protein